MTTVNMTVEHDGFGTTISKVFGKPLDDFVIQTNPAQQIAIERGSVIYARWTHNATAQDIHAELVDAKMLKRVSKALGVTEDKAAESLKKICDRSLATRTIPMPKMIKATSLEELAKVLSQL